MDVKESLEEIRDAKNQIILVPFHGAMVPVMVQELTEAQILACGNFSLIETFKDKINAKKMQSGKNLLKVIEYTQMQHELCRRSLISPTYDQIIKMVSNSSVEDAKKRISEQKEKIKQTPAGKERDNIMLELDKLSLWADYVLPADFTSVIVAYSLGIDKSDIKEISNEMLLESALLAERGNDNPADHIKGRFTDFNIGDINRRAWIALEDERKKKGKSNQWP